MRDFISKQKVTILSLSRRYSSLHHLGKNRFAPDSMNPSIPNIDQQHLRICALAKFHYYSQEESTGYVRRGSLHNRLATRQEKTRPGINHPKKFWKSFHRIKSPISVVSSASWWQWRPSRTRGNLWWLCAFRKIKIYPSYPPAIAPFPPNKVIEKIIL